MSSTVSPVMRLLPAKSSVLDTSEENTRITVHQTISSFAFLYEKIRTAVDDKDEHLIRKAAIVRILKRQLTFEHDAMVISGHVIRELIAARYLLNGVVPEARIGEVAVPIAKLQRLLASRIGNEKHRDWLLGIVAVEIETLLAPPDRERALVSFLFDRVRDRLVVKGMDADEAELEIQIRLACERTAVKADDARLSFTLVKTFWPEWMRPDLWGEQIAPIAERMVGIESRVAQSLRHPLGPRFAHAVLPWAVSLGVVRDVLFEKPELQTELEKAPEKVWAAVVRKTDERYARSRAKLRRGTVRAILYLLVTKVFVAFALELPLEWYWFHTINIMALAINLAFPPLTMFLVGLFIRLPGADNTARVKEGAMAMLSPEPLPTKEVRAPRESQGMRLWSFRLIYVLAFVVSFGGVALVLRALDFTWVSAAIFIFFLCVVSFFAFRLRRTARDMVVVEKRQGLATIVLDFFSLPILRAGQWLSQTVSRLNIFIFLFDFLIEAPFKLFLDVLEEWFAFLKEKKEELQ